MGTYHHSAHVDSVPAIAVHHFTQLHADNTVSLRILCFCVTLITNHRPYWTIVKLLVLTHCRRCFEMLHRLWMFHGGDGAEAGANNCKPFERIILGRITTCQPSCFWFAARVVRWFHVGGGVATTLLSCTRGRSDVSNGTTFRGCGHCSERSQWVDEFIGDVRHPAFDDARGFRSDDAHDVAQYVATAASRVSCPIQLKLGSEYPEHARFLEPIP